MTIPKTLGFNYNKVVGGGGGLNKKLFKSKKYPVLEHTFTFFRLAFIDIWIETKFQNSLFL